MAYGKLNEQGQLISTNTQLDDSFQELSLFEIKDEDGNGTGEYYEFYNQDGTPDVDKCSAKALEDLVTTGERLVKQYIQDVIDAYNKAYGVKFESVYNCTMYKDITDYEHQQFCIDALAFNALVWAETRTIQKDILAGNIEVPTDEEFIAMLPAYEGVV